MKRLTVDNETFKSASVLITKIRLPTVRPGAFFPTKSCRSVVSCCWMTSLLTSVDEELSEDIPAFFCLTWGVVMWNGNQPMLQAGISMKPVHSNRSALFRLSSSSMTSMGSRAKVGMCFFKKHLVPAGTNPNLHESGFVEHSGTTQWQSHRLIALFSFHKGHPNFRYRRRPYKMNAN